MIDAERASKGQGRSCQVIVCMPESSMKVQNLKEFHDAYGLILIGCINGYNLTVDSFCTLR